MGVELLFNSVEFGSQSSCQQTPRELETRCGGEGHTRPHPTEGALGKAPMEWTPRPPVEHLREQERHNVTVITVGSKYEAYVRSPASSHLNKPFEPLQIKWEVTMLLKKCSCVFLPASFLHASFCVRLYSCVFVLDASFIIVSVFIQYIYMYTTIFAQALLTISWVIFSEQQKIQLYPWIVRRLERLYLKAIKKAVCSIYIYIYIYIQN